jgi:hypothetical protein
MEKTDLSSSDFKEFPVWTWNEEMTALIPIHESNLTEDECCDLFIRAKLKSEGHEFDGYLIGDETFFAFAIFAEEREFVFNLNLPDRIRLGIKELSQATGIQFSSFFPVDYISDVQFKSGRHIVGRFE